MHILIIDDDPRIRETLADILSLNGYKVVTASNGEEGIALASQSLPALIITDILMPIMDGFALLGACREDPQLQMVPVIVTSAKDGREDIRHAMELGAADYISKPFVGALRPSANTNWLGGSPRLPPTNPQPSRQRFRSAG